MFEQLKLKTFVWQLFGFVYKKLWVSINCYAVFMITIYKCMSSLLTCHVLSVCRIFEIESYWNMNGGYKFRKFSLYHFFNFEATSVNFKLLVANIFISICDKYRGRFTCLRHQHIHMQMSAEFKPKTYKLI